MSIDVRAPPRRLRYEKGPTAQELLWAHMLIQSFVWRQSYCCGKDVGLARDIIRQNSSMSTDPALTVQDARSDLRPAT